RNEQISPPTNGQPLAKNPIVVESLTKLLTEALASASNDDEDIRHQEFLARTLGALDADAKTLPVLAEAMKDSHDIVVRKSALMAVALIAGRHFDDATGYTSAVASGADTLPLADRNLPLTTATIADSEIVNQLRRSAQDSDPVIRHLAGYALGSVSGPDSLQQLRVMLSDGNHLAQANAAIGLARNGSIDGVPTMVKLMASSLKPFKFETDTTVKEAATPEEIRQAEVLHWIEESKVASNCLKAVSDLWPQIDSEQRNALLQIVRQMEQEFPGTQIQQKASDTLKMIGQP
ncbi:MAG: HEAT repeat domain-containing protein, partial [Planctomycetota bacterium]|nr:HEAT repeat domain-containing protein [Planctomycetota bacterium]